jgi:hypothetical protein
MPPEARRRRFVRFAPPTGEVGRARVDAWRRLWRFAAPKGAVNRHSLGGSGAMAAAIETTNDSPAWTKNAVVFSRWIGTVIRTGRGHRVRQSWMRVLRNVSHLADVR